jgi:hypothetical protein
VAFDNATYTRLVLDWEEESRTIATQRSHPRRKSRISGQRKQE